MNDYYLKVKQSDLAKFYEIALALGVLISHPESQDYYLAPELKGNWDPIGNVYKPTGEIIYGEAYEEPVYQHVQYEVGIFGDKTLYELRWEPTGKTKTVIPETKVTALVVDETNTAYWHANLRLDGMSLMEIAQTKAKTEPLIAKELSNLSQWFVTDQVGKPTQPKNLTRVYL